MLRHRIRDDTESHDNYDQERCEEEDRAAIQRVDDHPIGSHLVVDEPVADHACSCPYGKNRHQRHERKSAHIMPPFLPTTTLSKCVKFDTLQYATIPPH